MRHLVSRRRFMTATSLALPVAHVSAFQQDEAASSVAEAFPQHPPAMVRETVITAHGNIKRLRELVDAHPALARAAYDWGFGDWEDALGAASHTGSRDIAEYLISNGARPTLFSAAMLGQLETVKAFLAAHPGAQRIPGPHSISLLAHAKAGGAAAAAVYQYLDQLGDAGGPKTEPISDEEKAALAGTYVFGRGAADRFDVTVDKGQLTFKRPGMAFGRPINHVGGHAFFPAGAAAVRIRFAIKDSEQTLTVQDGAIVLTATKRA